MTHRERFRKTVLREQVDRVAYDLCGSGQTLVDYQETKDALATYLGFAGEKQGDFPLDDRILRFFDIDTRMVGGVPTPKTVHNREDRGVHYDSYGIGYRMVGGHFEICHNPLKDCTIDEMIAYPLPDADDIDPAIIQQWASQAQYLHEKTDYAVIATHPILGVFEVGCWLFGFDDYLYRMAAEPELVYAFSDRVYEYQKKVIDMYYGALGKYICCTTSGDDFGTQIGQFFSNTMFDEFIKPYFKNRIEYTKKYTDGFYQHHTCGSVFDLIPAMIDCGVDILNPIQPGTYMMEPKRLKDAYGDKLCFWGGIDTQELLPKGSPEDVARAVKDILSVMGGSGYILSPAHCIQWDVPVENIAAIYGC